MADSDNDIFDEEQCHNEISSDVEIDNQNVNDNTDVASDLQEEVIQTTDDLKSIAEPSTMGPTEVIFNELKITVSDPEKKTKTTP